MNVLLEERCYQVKDERGEAGKHKQITKRHPLYVPNSVIGGALDWYKIQLPVPAKLKK